MKCCLMVFFFKKYNLKILKILVRRKHVYDNFGYEDLKNGVEVDGALIGYAF